MAIKGLTVDSDPEHDACRVHASSSHVIDPEARWSIVSIDCPYMGCTPCVASFCPLTLLGYMDMCMTILRLETDLFVLSAAAATLLLLGHAVELGKRGRATQ